MFKSSLLFYLRLGERIQDLVVSLYMNENTDPDGKPGQLTEGEVELMHHVLDQMAIACKKLGLESALRTIARNKSDPPKTEREFRRVIDQFYDEVERATLLAIPNSRASFFERDHLSADTSKKFPIAAEELREAGTAFAVGRFTSSVFHSMRAAETGIHAIATVLQVTFPAPVENQQWGNILEKIEAQIGKIKSQPKNASKDDDLKFFSEAAIQFGYLKDAWRNRVTHSRAIYDESKARSVLEHTVTLFEQLAARLEEPEQPSQETLVVAQ